jgi:hypothetical protein
MTFDRRMLKLMLAAMSHRYDRALVKGGEDPEKLRSIFKTKVRHVPCGCRDGTIRMDVTKNVPNMYIGCCRKLERLVYVVEEDYEYDEKWQVVGAAKRLMLKKYGDGKDKCGSGDDELYALDDDQPLDVVWYVDMFGDHILHVAYEFGFDRVLACLSSKS